MDSKYHIVYIPGTLTVIGPLTLAFPSSPNGQVGTPYSATLTAAGGLGPYTFSISAGTLPAGLTRNTTTGAITGTPTTAVGGPAANLTAKVVDSRGTQATANGAINISAEAALKLTFPGGANGQVGTAYSVTLTATGGFQPYTFSISAGTLPAGLELNASTGAITGTPTATVSGPAANLTAKVVDFKGAIHHRQRRNQHQPTPSAEADVPGRPGRHREGGHAVHPYAICDRRRFALHFLDQRRHFAGGSNLNASTGVISGTPTKAVSGPAANLTAEGGGFLWHFHHREWRHHDKPIGRTFGLAWR